MWTEEARISELIFTRVEDKLAQVLLYQAFFHIETFKYLAKELHEAKDALDFHNFARSQSCHMTEGIFGQEIHAAKMESAKIRTFGFLGITLSSGHKFLRSVASARDRDRKSDWVCVQEELRYFPELYRRARNALEHLDQSISRGEVRDDQDLGFSIHSGLHFKDRRGASSFNFSREELEKVTGIWTKVVSMLDSRQKPRSTFWDMEITPSDGSNASER